MTLHQMATILQLRRSHCNPVTCNHHLVTATCQALRQLQHHPTALMINRYLMYSYLYSYESSSAAPSSPAADTEALPNAMKGSRSVLSALARALSTASAMLHNLPSALSSSLFQLRFQPFSKVPTARKAAVHGNFQFIPRPGAARASSSSAASSSSTCSSSCRSVSNATRNCNATSDGKNDGHSPPLTMVCHTPRSRLDCVNAS